MVSSVFQNFLSIPLDGLIQKTYSNMKLFV